MQNVILAAVAASVVGSMAGYSYSAEQARQAGFAFGNELLAIQEGVGELQSSFSSHVVRREEGDLTEREFADFAEGHFQSMGELISRYDDLEPPGTFRASVEIFKLSSESQLRSDMEYASWIRTGDDSHLVRSNALIQEAFEYEAAALGEFNRAKLGVG